ncbi:MAG TPA: GNAT family N-acetyltransferase [Acidimicrobiia bacterium]
MSRPGRLERLSADDVDRLTELYAAEWWTSHRSRDDVARLVEAPGQVLFGARDEEGNLVGFARAITDGVYKALILDVIVHPDRRGSDLGAGLMDAISSELSDVEHHELYCLPELVAFYQRWGYTKELGDLTFMRASVRARP